MLMAKLQHADEALFLRLSRSNWRQLVITARWLSRSADGYLYPLLLLLAYYCSPAQGERLLWLTATTFALERPLYWLLKNSWRRYRPAERLVGVAAVVQPADRFSLPSGHTAGAFVMATLLAQCWPLLAVPLYLWAALVGWSRVALRVHFPADVLVGALIGCLMALLVVAVGGGL